MVLFMKYYDARKDMNYVKRLGHKEKFYYEQYSWYFLKNKKQAIERMVEFYKE